MQVQCSNSYKASITDNRWTNFKQKRADNVISKNGRWWLARRYQTLLNQVYAHTKDQHMHTVTYTCVLGLSYDKHFSSINHWIQLINRWQKSTNFLIFWKMMWFCRTTKQCASFPAWGILFYCSVVTTAAQKLIILQFRGKAETVDVICV